MKKFLLLFILSICYLYANVGSIVAVDGEVFILRDALEIKVKLNDIVKKDDTIKSLDNSKTQILFSDDTVVTIGKNSILNIQEYLVDTASNSNIALNIPKGIFRVMTGSISKIAPEKFKLKTKNATIGIRGTIFIGETNNVRDKIACLKGVVIVEAQGKLVDLHEGEVIYIEVGKTPETPKTYKTGEIENIETFSEVSAEFRELSNDIVESMDLDNEYLVDQSLESSFLQNIREIDNVNNQAATYNLYVDSLYDEFYKLLDEKYFETEVDGFAVNEYQNLFGDGYIPLHFTYFTIYEPQGDTMRDLMEAIPFYVKRGDEYTNKTSESKIAEYMGGVNPWTNKIYEHWNAKASGRKLVSFNGNIIGQVSSKGEELIVSLIDPQQNSSSVLIDFGNRFFTGSFAYQAPNFTTGETEFSYFTISSVDEASLSTTGFHTHGDNYSIQNGRFYGDNLNQISASFIVEDFKNDNNIYGEFVANNSAQYDVKKLYMGGDDFFSWGYWNTELIGNLGTWIEPKIENTPVDVISDYIVQQQLYTYNGGIIGTFSRISKGLPTEPMSGSFFLDIDFGKSSMEGYFYLTATEDVFGLSITQGIVDEKGFTAREFINNSTTSTQTIKELDINGQFFGADAQKIGGGIKFETDAGDIGIGAFIGTKSE